MLRRSLVLSPTLAIPGLFTGGWLGARRDANAAGSEMPPIEAFFEDPVLSGAKLSPDGRALAMRVAAKGVRPRLAVLDLATMKPTIVASFSESDVAHFQWVNHQRLVFDLVPEAVGPGLASHAPGLFAVDRDGENFRHLVETTRHFISNGDTAVKLLPWNTFLLGDPGQQDSDDVLVVVPQEMSKDRLDYVLLQRLNTRTGRAVEVESPLHSFAWLLDGQGQLRVVTTRQKDQVAIHLRAADGAWKKIAEFASISERWVRPRFIAPDGTVYVEAPLGDKSAVFTLDPATGQIGDKPVAASKDFDLHAEFVADRHKLLGLRYTIDAEVTQWLDADARALQAKLDAVLPNTANRISMPRAGGSPWVLVESFADQQPLLTQLYHRETGKFSRLGTSHPAIDPRQMAQTDFVRYAARDGLSIPAYLTLPKGSAKSNLPMVVLVHGGPFVRGTSWRWDAEVQFLASRGYAVLQPEFRGSAGFGGKHMEAGFRQWGQAMQTDLADGARWAIAQGFADPKRLCIAGASYGGYAALMGLIQNPELFRCAIDWLGVTDLDLWLSVDWSDLDNDYRRYGAPRLIGDPVADAAMFKAASPLRNAERITQPLLMAYGAWDVRVPLVHGQKFRDAVLPHNRQVEWVVYPEEGHGWSRPATRLDFWGRVEKFLARHLAPGASSAAVPSRPPG